MVNVAAIANALSTRLNWWVAFYAFTRAVPVQIL
jgi:hypothetical protein